MRLRLLRNIIMAGAKSVQIQAGSMVEATPETAKKWLDAGVAEIVKAQTIETAELPAAENAMQKPPIRKKAGRK